MKIKAILRSSKTDPSLPAYFPGWFQERFGPCFAQLSVDTTLKLKSACKDVVRARLGCVPEDVEELCKRFRMPPQGVSDYNFVMGYAADEGYVHGSAEPGHAGTDEALLTFIERYPDDWEVVKKSLGLARQKGRHACAFAIADRPIANFIPMTSVSGVPVTSFTAPSVEAVGGLKMDFLVVNSLRDIQDCIRLIQERHAGGKLAQEYLNGRRVPGHRIVPLADGTRADVWDLPEDQAVFKDVAEGRTETVFQFCTPSAVQWLAHFNYTRADGTKAIRSIEDMAAFTALDRPGPLDIEVANPEWVGPPDDPHARHNMLVEYARRARGAPGSPDVLPVLDELVPETYGVMCVAEGTPIKTARGPVPIEQVADGDIVDWVQTHTGNWELCTALIPQGVKSCVRLRFTTGMEVVVTPDHRLFTNRGWVEAQDLTTDDLVKQEWISDERLPEGNEADWIIGLLLADGNLCASTPEVACSSREFAESVKNIADRAWGLDSVVFHRGTTWHCRLRHVGRSGTTPNPLTTWLRREGLLGCDYATKRFPSSVSRAMVVGFFEGDGCVENRRLRVKNRALAWRFFECLQALRVASSFHEDEPGVWAVSVCEALPLLVKKEKDSLEGGYTLRPDLSKIQKSDGHLYYNHKRSKRPFITRRAYRTLQRRYSWMPQSEPAVWGRLISRKSVGPTKVYDLSVEVDHSFIAGGHAMHNCYQEQLQRVYQNLTGCSGPEAEEFRTNVAKKKKEKVDAAYPKFMERAGARFSKEDAQKLWDFIKTWGQYGFNKSHAVCYAIIGYACAYLKHYYPLEWWCAVLRNATRDEVNTKFWKHCGHLVALPDINFSGDNWYIEGDRLRAPVSLLHGVGEKAHEQLCRYAPYDSVLDLARKIKQHQDATAALKQRKVKGKEDTYETVLVPGCSAIQRKTIYTLIVAGAMDSLFPRDYSVEECLRDYDEAMAEVFGKKYTKTKKTSYPVLDPLGRYQLRKEILPAYGTDLRKLVKAVGCPDFLRIDESGKRMRYTWQRWSRADRRVVPTDVSVVGFEKLEELNHAPKLPEYGFTCAVVAHVEDRKFKKYGPFKDKNMCVLTLEVGGDKYEFVHWPNGDGVLPPHVQALEAGTVIAALLVRNREDRPFSVREFKVVRPPLGSPKEDEEPKEQNEEG